MKCEPPAFASVPPREPAPIQNPSATERTPGTRSEMTRSPESSSERTYFCTAAIIAVSGEGGHELAVCLQQPVDELVDLPERELRRRVRVEHRRVVDVLALPRQRGLDRQRLDVDVRLHQRRELRRQRSDRL